MPSLSANSLAFPVQPDPTRPVPTLLCSSTRSPLNNMSTTRSRSLFPGVCNLRCASCPVFLDPSALETPGLGRAADRLRREWREREREREREWERGERRGGGGAAHASEAGRQAGRKEVRRVRTSARDNWIHTGEAQFHHNNTCSPIHVSCRWSRLFVYF